MHDAHQSEFLGGKVRRLSLPLLEAPAPAWAPLLKRLALPQGELAQIHDGDEGMRYVAVIEFLPGVVRGNHFHKHKEEWVYLIQGEVRLTVEDTKSRARESLTLGAGDLVWIGVEIAHAFQANQAGCGIELSPARFDPQDTYRVVVAP
jgi:quercetin dioxygenase-like cupin family protein